MADAAEELTALTIGQIIVGALALAGLIFTLIYTIKATNAATKSADIAERHFAASERPWVSVSVVPSSSLAFTPTEGRMAFRFQLKNIGKAPAASLHVEAKLLVDMRAAVEEMERIKDEAKRGEPLPERRDFLGDTLFPEEIAVHDISLPVSRADIAALFQGVGIEMGMVTPFLVGAVYYKSPVDGKYHRTGFNQQLTQIDGAGRPSLAIMTVDGETPLDQLRLMRGLFSGYVA